MSLPSGGVRVLGHVSFFFQAEDGIRDYKVTGVQTCALPIFRRAIIAALRPASAPDAARAWDDTARAFPGHLTGEGRSAARQSGSHKRCRRGCQRSEEHTSELQSPCNLVCRLLLEKKKSLNREISSPDNTPITDAIQTDAAITNGKSDIPLLNIASHVISVTSHIQNDYRATDSVGF